MKAHSLGMDRMRPAAILWILLAIAMAALAFGTSHAQPAQSAEGTAQEAADAGSDPDAADASDDASAAGEAAEQAGEPRELTLWSMITNGGVILWIIFGLSVFGFILAFYLFLTVTVNREVPPGFVEKAYREMKVGDLRGAYELCEGRDELIANVLRAGLKMAGHDRYVIQEAMESEGERGATALWQRISYLNNIGHIAPLLGLLGTVWGMIQAFGSIALDDAQVKGLRMAESVAQAMITTAAGLALAIPAMVIYFYLRGRVVKIIAAVESHASEMMELVNRSARP